MTREEWLNAAIIQLRPLFEKHAAIPETVRISVGWPGGRGPKRNVIGQCWGPHTTDDNTPAIFISPVLKDPISVLVTVVHELVHACGRMGHRGQFAKLAGSVGLTKPWKSTPASEELLAHLHPLAETLGPYDHARIGLGDGPNVQTTRMLKVVCPECDYTLRTTQKWLDVGVPTCCCGTVMSPA